MRNAKIKNTYTGNSTPYSIGIYIDGEDLNDQTIEIENLIIVTGTTSNDASIYRVGSTDIHIKCLGLFVNKSKSAHVELDIGDAGNYKYIISADIS